ncbi:hypothetical protein OG21DRAFT_377050 [Imleria badia]|nr:hypothetical protein OG21DRAFT_377050 [Imleria badia]
MVVASAPSDIMTLGLMFIWGMCVCTFSWLFCSATTVARTLGTGEQVIVTKVTCQWIARVMSRQKLEWADKKALEAETVSFFRWLSQLARGRIRRSCKPQVSPDEKTTLLNHDVV